MAAPHLIISSPAGRKDVALDGGPLTVGRNFTNLLVLDEPMASRFHCVIEQVKDGLRLRDLDSRNGTRLNGKPVKEALLVHGDTIAIGKTEMKVVMPASARGKSSDHAEEADAADDLAEMIDPDADLIPDDEMIDADAIVEADEDLGPGRYEPEGPIALDTQSPDDDVEGALRDRADSLSDKTFADGDIALINARGQVAHAPRPGGGRSQTGEAVTTLRLIMLICFRSRATDIHVEPKADQTHVRIRVDGSMVDVITMTKELGVKLLSLVKVLSDIDIAQKSIVQEGSFSARVPSARPGQPPRRVDYRVSFAPAMFGQKLVVRVLDTANAPLHIDDLGLPDRIVHPIKAAIEQESGMLLVCGPTGSGKTTTLYAALRDIDTNDRNVVTIEDPVEIQLAGVTQLPVKEAEGNTFPVLLRSVLRQDPDAILVGEVRDAETARTAMQAAMTGHLVFSTVHSRDTVGALYRLLDLGVEPYLVASGLHLVLAQRLVRQLCVHCKTPFKPTPEQVAKMNKNGVTKINQIFGPRGCRRCLGTGYLGRRGVMELLTTTQELRDVILRSPTVQDIQKSLGADNYVRLAETGYQLVADGVTSFEEVERAVS
jgi:general secretion pathway protein E